MGLLREQLLQHGFVFNEYLASLGEGSIEAMQEFRDSGDFCQLRDALAKNAKSHLGIPTYDYKQEIWAADLTTENAIREMAWGLMTSTEFRFRH